MVVLTTGQGLLVDEAPAVGLAVVSLAVHQVGLTVQGLLADEAPAVGPVVVFPTVHLVRLTVLAAGGGGGSRGGRGLATVWEQADQPALQLVPPHRAERHQHRGRCPLGPQQQVEN